MQDLLSEYIVAIAVLVVLAAAAVFDVWAVATSHNTASHVFYSWSQKFPLLPFLAGVLACHLFGSVIKE